MPAKAGLREIPGARNFVELLLSDDSFVVAIATGGWYETAILKLHGIGIEPGKIPMATSSDSGDRCEIIRLAEQRSVNGKPVTKKTYFGDGPWDKEATSHLEYNFAVGNGVPHHTVVPDLSDWDTILTKLHG